MARSSLSTRNKKIRGVVIWWMQLLELIKVLVIVASNSAQMEEDTCIPRRLRKKSFPHYDNLHNVFGRDRATGNEAMNFVDMVKGDANEESSIGESPSVQVVGQTRKRKRSSPTSEKFLIALAIKELGEKITETGMALCAALQDGKKTEMQRQLMRDIVKIYPMISFEQEMFLLGKIGKDVDMLNMFCGLDDEKKERFVTSLLHDRVRDPNHNDHNV